MWRSALNYGGAYLWVERPMAEELEAAKKAAVSEMRHLISNAGQELALALSDEPLHTPVVDTNSAG
jgi:hypothetical protein